MDRLKGIQKAAIWNINECKRVTDVTTRDTCWICLLYAIGGRCVRPVSTFILALIKDNPHEELRRTRSTRLKKMNSWLALTEYVIQRAFDVEDILPVQCGSLTDDFPSLLSRHHPTPPNLCSGKSCGLYFRSVRIDQREFQRDGHPNLHKWVGRSSAICVVQGFLQLHMMEKRPRRRLAFCCNCKQCNQEEHGSD